MTVSFTGIGSASMLFTLLISTTAMAQFAPYSDFQNMSEADLVTLQAKLTYGGIQEEPIASIVITSTGGTVNVGQFAPFHHAGFSYGNDARPVRQLAASTAQLHAMIQNAGNIPAVPAGGVGTPPYVSFALVNTLGGTTEGFEVILNPSDSAALLDAIRSAFSGVDLRALEDFGCAASLHPPGVPTDVSSSVGVTLSGVRLDRSTGRFVGTATLQNNGAGDVPIPLSLALKLPTGVTLFNAIGSTCSVGPAGRPFINADLSSPLAPGASTIIALDYANPNRVPIAPVTTAVLAGPGGR